VIWCTGYDPGFSWIDLPIFDSDRREPRHSEGVVEGEPGLYFVGLFFLYAPSSTMIHGVGRDAARMAAVIAERIARDEHARRPLLNRGPRAPGRRGSAFAAPADSTRAFRGTASSRNHGSVR
jgi:hypothetical protein